MGGCQCQSPGACSGCVDSCGKGCLGSCGEQCASICGAACKGGVTVNVTGHVAYVVVVLILVLGHVNPIVLVLPMQVEQNLIFLK